MNSCYEYRCFIPFHLADPAGILFFGHVFQLTHQAFEQFAIDKLECTWVNWFQNEHWIVPLKRVEADYLAPIKAGEECLIQLAIDEVSQSSFSINYQLIQSQLCCTVSTIHVFCDRLTKKKIAIPEKFLQAFYALEQHKLQKSSQLNLAFSNSEIL